MMRRLNLVLLAILVVGLGVLGGGLHLVHGVQVRRNASPLLDRARRAEADGQPAKAEDALRWYLSLRPDDGDAWRDYARVVDRETTDSGRIERIFLVYQQALSRQTLSDTPDVRKMKRRCADLAMELGRWGDAEGLLSELRGRLPAEALAERAELADLLGQCAQSLGRHE